MYCYHDDKITRPFFAHVRAPAGVQVTRHHPPIEGQDIVDHDTFHPGIWMSFGDISGSDYWRIKARVRHAEFVERAAGRCGKGTFAVRNQYLDQKDPSKVVCEEIARYTFLVRPAGYLLLWDSTFSSDHEFDFGDQEEMGLGFRVATPLRVGASGEDNLPPGNGTILDSEGRKNGDAGVGQLRRLVRLQRHDRRPTRRHDNLLPSREFPAKLVSCPRLRAAGSQPFGRQAFGKGEASKVVVKPGEKMRIALRHLDSLRAAR